MRPKFDTIIWDKICISLVLEKLTSKKDSETQVRFFQSIVNELEHYNFKPELNAVLLESCIRQKLPDRNCVFLNKSSDMKFQVVLDIQFEENLECFVQLDGKSFDDVEETIQYLVEKFKQLPKLTEKDPELYQVDSYKEITDLLKEVYTSAQLRHVTDCRDEIRAIRNQNFSKDDAYVEELEGDYLDSIYKGYQKEAEFKLSLSEEDFDYIYGILQGIPVRVKF